MATGCFGLRWQNKAVWPLSTRAEPLPSVLSEHDGKDATVYAQLGGRLPYLSVYDHAQGDEPCEGFEAPLLAYLQSFVLHGRT